MILSAPAPVDILLDLPVLDIIIKKEAIPYYLKLIVKGKFNIIRQVGTLRYLPMFLENEDRFPFSSSPV